jgi:hypothetical protein
MTDKTTVQIRFDGVEQPYRCARKAADFAFRVAPKTPPRKARPTIAAAVAWIALNDECAEMDADVVAGFISVVLAADLFGVSAETIAKKVVRYREEHA